MPEPANFGSRTERHVPVLELKSSSQAQLEDTVSKIGLDLSIEEIAERLGISEESARALVEAARSSQVGTRE